MILFKALKFVSLVALAGMAGASAEPVDLEKAVASLVAAEKAYAKLGAEKGFREASLTVLADDAVIFAPGVVNGRKFWREAKEDPVISWGPAFAAIARSGELGYTTGPFEYRKVRGGEKPEAFGHFVSVWRKDSDGTWKVVVDVGVNHRQPQEGENQVANYVPRNLFTHPETARADLKKQRSAFAESLEKDEGAAVVASASDEIRIYRRGAIPAVGRAAAEQMLGPEHGKTSRTRSGGGMSKANDLAYEYGEYSSGPAGATERGIYFCIWRPEPSGQWRLVLDLQKKAPPPES